MDLAGRREQMNEREGVSTQISAVPWWLMLITGIASVVLGVFLIIAPVQTIVTLVQVLGIYWLVTGVFSIVSIIVNRSHWVWKLFSGVLSIIAGIFIVQLPLWMQWTALTLFIALIFVAASMGIIAGGAFLIWAFIERNWGVGILAALSIVLGIVLFISPYIALAILPFVLGGLAILGGIGAIVSSFSLRKAPAMQAHPAS
jgi:uncharacterized membrane protein HdeD (DUF308 family)